MVRVRTRQEESQKARLANLWRVGLRCSLQSKERFRAQRRCPIKPYILLAPAVLFFGCDKETQDTAEDWPHSGDYAAAFTVSMDQFGGEICAGDASFSINDARELDGSGDCTITLADPDLKGVVLEVVFEGEVTLAGDVTGSLESTELLDEPADLVGSHSEGTTELIASPASLGEWKITRN